MIAGHFGFAAAVKSRETKVPLWALMLACQWLDVLFVPTYGLKLEGLETIGEGHYGQVIIHADWTHSLVSALVLSALLGAFFKGRARVVIALVAFSHWVLDFIVHRPDMPIVPLGATRLGLGLWTVPWAAAAAELVLVVGGGLLYWRAARATGRLHEASLAGAVVIASGLLTLGLNLAAP